MYSRSLSALAFTADFPPAAFKFYQRTHRVRLKNLNTSDKKSSRKIKHKKIPRAHKRLWEIIIERGDSEMSLLFLRQEIGSFPEPKILIYYICTLGISYAPAFAADFLP